MEYELAKRLTDAGFLQPKRWGKVLEHCTCGSTEYMGDKKVHAPNSDCLLIEPTLEELIEACGPHKYFTLTQDRNKDVWLASIANWDGSLPMQDWYEGRNPSEAVANLWL